MELEGATAGLQETPAIAAMQAIAATVGTQEVRGPQATTAAETGMPEELGILQEAPPPAMAMREAAKVDPQGMEDPRTPEGRRAKAIHPPEGIPQAEGMLPRAAALRVPQCLEGCQTF